MWCRKLLRGVVRPLRHPQDGGRIAASRDGHERGSGNKGVKEECLDQLILFGERSLRHALVEYLAHYHHERNHQGLDKVIPFPDSRAGLRLKSQATSPPGAPKSGNIAKTERLGGLLKFYHREAA
jgi:putative transposase